MSKSWIANSVKAIAVAVIQYRRLPGSDPNAIDKLKIANSKLTIQMESAANPLGAPTVATLTPLRICVNAETMMANQAINKANVLIENFKFSKQLDFETDNGNDHRAGTEIVQAEKSTRKSGFACIVLLYRVAILFLVSICHNSQCKVRRRHLYTCTIDRHFRNSNLHS